MRTKPLTAHCFNLSTINNTSFETPTLSKLNKVNFKYIGITVSFLDLRIFNMRDLIYAFEFI